MGHCRDKGPLFLWLSHPHRLGDDVGEVIWGQISPWLRGGEGGKRLHPSLEFPWETGSPFCPGPALAPGSQMTPSSPVSLPAGEGIHCTVNSPAQLLTMILRAGEVGQGTAQTCPLILLGGLLRPREGKAPVSGHTAHRACVGRPWELGVLMLSRTDVTAEHCATILTVSPSRP